MDPVTIISGATLAFNTIKKGIALGRDLQDMSGQLSKWAGAMSDLGRVESKAKNPPWWKALSGTVQQDAMQIFAAKKKAEEMREELKFFISFNMGPSAWDELIAIEASIRKQKQDQEYRKEEIKETILTWLFGTLAIIAAISILGLGFYYLGSFQGKW